MLGRRAQSLHLSYKVDEVLEFSDWILGRGQPILSSSHSAITAMRLCASKAILESERERIRSQARERAVKFTMIAETQTLLFNKPLLGDLPNLYVVLRNQKNVDF